MSEQLRPYASSKIFTKALFSNFFALMITVLLLPGFRFCFASILISFLSALLSGLVLLLLLDPLYLILKRLHRSRLMARIELRYFVISYLLTLIESTAICDPILVVHLSILHVLIFIALSYLEKFLE
jgi:hypothetical protein